MSSSTATSTGRVPVTVLTGFLGSGKTTLLNQILTKNHGKRIAVIENEFGEVGIDNELVINAEEEIFEMNNGCICCTVRGDLIRILGNLMNRKDKFDYIMIETTGLADPAPVAQTFFVDDDMREKLVLDGIVTIVDAKHVWLHLEDSSECQEQIAFADVILLNKIDLVPPAELDKLEDRIRAMNTMAKIHRTQNAELEMDHILNVGGFDLDRALGINPAFLEPEYPFEWGGTFDLTLGDHELVLQDGPDPEMQLALVKTSGTDAVGIAAVQEQVVLVFSDDEQIRNPGDLIQAGPILHELQLVTEGDKRFVVRIDDAGPYVLFTQHGPDEFSTVFRSPSGAVLEPISVHEFNPEHEHDDEVTSIAVTQAGELDGERLNRWFSTLLQEKGPDIFRMKGILAIKGSPTRFIFQGVHMLFDGRPDKPWPNAERLNQLVFIGRNLDRDELTEGFKACFA